jgi:MoaA/NifB/PqqE/SkfB family radical SAM enzyme
MRGAVAEAGRGVVGRLGSALRGLGRPLQVRLLEAIQIEVTSRCNLRCVMCPVTALGRDWHPRHLPWDTFLRIAAAFAQTRFVHLQGWGEPLLHPRLLDMIRVAKDAGCRVGFTTNGTRLTVPIAEQLLDVGLDILAVSIAGATPATHAGIRVGSALGEVLDHVRGLVAVRNGRRSRRPKVEIFFLMTTTSIAELPEAAELAASVGADELVATNLDYVPTAVQDELRVFGRRLHGTESRRAVAEARVRAGRAGLAFRAYPLDLAEAAVCDANPLKVLFVSSDGQISPCPYLGLAGQTEIPRMLDSQRLRVPRLGFGDLREQELLAIWESPDYRAFRGQFRARRAAGLVSAVAATAGARPPGPGTLPPAPDPCRTCPKLFGT